MLFCFGDIKMLLLYRNRKVVFEREQNCICEVGTHSARSIGSSWHCAAIFHIFKTHFLCTGHCTVFRGNWFNNQASFNWFLWFKMAAIFGSRGICPYDLHGEEITKKNYKQEGCIFLPVNFQLVILQCFCNGLLVKFLNLTMHSHTCCKQQENCMKCTLSRNSTRYQMEALKPASAKDPKCAWEIWKCKT